MILATLWRVNIVLGKAAPHDDDLGSYITNSKRTQQLGSPWYFVLFTQGSRRLAVLQCFRSPRLITS